MAFKEGALALLRTCGRGTRQGAADPDAAVARRVGWRLAALTVGLIAALLLLLDVAVYGTMQHVLLQRLQDTVRQRTAGFVQSHSGQQPGSPGPAGGPPPFQGRGSSIVGDVRFTVADQRLHVLQGLAPTRRPRCPIRRRRAGR